MRDKAIGHLDKKVAQLSFLQLSLKPEQLKRNSLVQDHASSNT